MKTNSKPKYTGKETKYIVFEYFVGKKTLQEAVLILMVRELKNQ